MSFVLGISADWGTWSAGDISALKGSFADFVIVATQGTHPDVDTGFVSAANGAGVSSIYNNSNGGGTSYGSGYYSQMKSTGLMCVSGESEPASEATDILSTGLIFMTYGGAGTGGGVDGNNDIWGTQYGPSKVPSGTKAAAWLEVGSGGTAVFDSGDFGVDAGLNKDAGCFEIGICWGTWLNGDGHGVSEAAEFVDSINSNIKSGSAPNSCVGLQMWGGNNGAGFQGTLSDGGGAGFMTSLASEFGGINLTTIAKRAGGATPTPGPPTPGPGPISNTAGCKLTATVRVQSYQPHIE